RDPLPAMLIGLTVTTGLVDAISVLGVGGVFTANMTGNLVFLGFAAVGTPGFSIPRSLTVLAAFLIGAVCGGRFAAALSGRGRRGCLSLVASVEAVLLLIAAVIALGFDRTTHEPTASLYALLVLTAVAMGIRNVTARRLAVPDITTSVQTGAL